MPQLAYTAGQPPAIPGMKADAGFDRVASRVNLNANPLPFGVFVKEAQGTFLNGADVVGATTDLLAGVSVASQTQPVTTAMTGAIDAIENTGIFDCMEQGAVWVRSEQVMIPGDPIFVRFANGAGGAGATNVRGVVRKDADTATAFRVRGARVIRSGVGPASEQMTAIFFDKAVQNTLYPLGSAFTP